MGSDVILALVVGGLLPLALAVPLFLAWTGRWRSFSRDARVLGRGWPFLALPALILMSAGPWLVGFETTRPLGYALMLGATVVFGVPFAFLSVSTRFEDWLYSWYGPRWFREAGRPADLDPARRLDAAAIAALGDGPSVRSTQLAEREVAGEPVKARIAAQLDLSSLDEPPAANRQGMVHGWAIVTERRVVFAAVAAEDRTRREGTVSEWPVGSIGEVVLEARDGRPDGSRHGHRGNRLRRRVRVRFHDHDDVVFETLHPGRLRRALQRAIDRADRDPTLARRGRVSA